MVVVDILLGESLVEKWQIEANLGQPTLFNKSEETQFSLFLRSILLKTVMLPAKELKINNANFSFDCYSHGNANQPNNTFPQAASS